jgi:hypothetical protein
MAEFETKVNYRKERLKELTDAQLVSAFNSLNQKHRYYTDEQIKMRADYQIEINTRNKRFR